MTTAKSIAATVALTLAAITLGGCAKTIAEVQVLDYVKRTPIAGAEVSIVYLGWAMVEEEAPEPSRGVTDPSGIARIEVKPIFGRPASLTVEKAGYTRKVIEIRSWASRVTFDLASKEHAREEKAVKVEKNLEGEGEKPPKKKKSR
jgi:hypothetical protein